LCNVSLLFSEQLSRKDGKFVFFDIGKKELTHLIRENGAKKFIALPFVEIMK
jgi:hypothetical protein